MVTTAKQERLRHALMSLISTEPDGTRLPTERALSEQLGVARETLRLAMRTLQDEGHIQRRQGTGTFVVAQAWVKPFALRSFSEDMRERGLKPSSRMLGASIIKADAKLAQHFKVSPGEPLHEVRRLRLADGLPMALETAYLVRSRLPGFKPKLLEKQSLYDVLARDFGIAMRSAKQQILATVVTADEAALLGVAAFSPALLVERHVLAATGELIEYGTSLYRADRYRFEVNVMRSSAEVAT